MSSPRQPFANVKSPWVDMAEVSFNQSPYLPLLETILSHGNSANAQSRLPSPGAVARFGTFKIRLVAPLISYGLLEKCLLIAALKILQVPFGICGIWPPLRAKLIFNETLT
ncbi:hypothetical protein Y1Q_0014259 [Alligator mississippiensis]|uniref:Uncharacterized protein n=1 Tax=Alligator mississippiensis TaxID=8496 RepID=A0A151LZJ1_ALLMI|nr:hypothetical protein Y1Q_0014259 [Alligator mississippiensis]